LVDVDADVRTLKWILNMSLNAGKFHSASEQGPVTGSCENDNGYSGSIKCGEFLDKLRDLFLKKKYVSWSSYNRNAVRSY
jgi:hypothetical protein